MNIMVDYLQRAKFFRTKKRLGQNFLVNSEVIEDIIDSGRTLSYLYEMLKSRNPKSLKICTLLDKPDRRIPESTITVDYTGFVIPDKFVVGYGLDDCQKIRNLPYVGVIE